MVGFAGNSSLLFRDHFRRNNPLLLHHVTNLLSKFRIVFVPHSNNSILDHDDPCLPIRKGKQGKFSVEGTVYLTFS